MPFALLVLEDSDKRRARPADVAAGRMRKMEAFEQGLRQRGVLQASRSLTSDADAARITVREGRRLVVDGPFAEAKELVGGFFLIDVATRAEALAIAHECPAVEWSTVEVRETGPCNE